MTSSLHRCPLWSTPSGMSFLLITWQSNTEKLTLLEGTTHVMGRNKYTFQTSSEVPLACRYHNVKSGEGRVLCGQRIKFKVLPINIPKKESDLPHVCTTLYNACTKKKGQ